MVLNKIFFFIIFLSCVITYSQSLTGVVQDTLGKPLPNANVIAKPATEGASLKFAIADFKGRYKLELEKNTNYQIRVSYIGHQEHVLNYQANSNLSNYNFILKQTGEQLKEVIITHKYEPVVVKKDTVTFKVDAFASGKVVSQKVCNEHLFLFQSYSFFFNILFCFEWERSGGVAEAKFPFNLPI